MINVGRLGCCDCSVADSDRARSLPRTVNSVQSYHIDSVDIGFVNGDGGSCTVRRQSPTPDLADEVLRPLYDGFVEGRACCFGYDEGGDHTSAHRVFMSRGRGNSQFPTRIQYCAVA